MLRKFFAGLVLASGVGFTIFADSDWVRYASVYTSAVCHARQMMTLPRDLDVVVLGSSRTRQAIDTAEIAAASGGRFARTYNLSQPGVAIERNAVMVRDLIERGHAFQVVVLEVDVDLLRTGRAMPWTWRGIAAGYARWSDILLRTPQTSAHARFADPRIVLHGLYMKLQRAALMVASGIVPAVIADGNPTPIRVCWRDDFDEADDSIARRHAAIAAARARRFGDAETALDHRFRRVNGALAHVELEELARIRTLVEQAGARLIVVRPQSYADPPYAPQVVQNLQTLIPEFRYPSEPLARRLSHAQVDIHHYGPEGRRLYSQWLAQTILADMGLPRPTLED